MSWSGGWCTEVREITNLLPLVSIKETDNICFKELVVQESPTVAVVRQLLSSYKSISPELIASISKKEEEKDTEKIAPEKDNISVGAPVVKESPQQENSSSDGFKSSAASYGSKCLDYPFKLKKASDPSSFLTELKDIALYLDKKEEKKTKENKKNPNKLKNFPPAAKIDSKSLQKHRHKKLNPSIKEERFEEKLPYVCFECKKMFGFYGSLDDHELSHALNRSCNE